MAVNATSRTLNRKYPLKPFGLNPMVSTFQRTARAFRRRRSSVSLAEGFGEVEEVGGDAGFKVIAAKRPVSATRGGRRKAVRKRR